MYLVIFLKMCLSNLQVYMTGKPTFSIAVPCSKIIDYKYKLFKQCIYFTIYSNVNHCKIFFKVYLLIKKSFSDVDDRLDISYLRRNTYTARY